MKQNSNYDFSVQGLKAQRSRFNPDVFPAVLLATAANLQWQAIPKSRLPSEAKGVYLKWSHEVIICLEPTWATDTMYLELGPQARLGHGLSGSAWGNV